MTDYNPQPMDTSDVELPPALQPLVEQLAEHVHDVWAAQRMADGWSYGPTRDDDKKHHPCLIPYDQLPEAEKTYDRATANATIAAILKLGAEIRWE